METIIMGYLGFSDINTPVDPIFYLLKVGCRVQVWGFRAWGSWFGGLGFRVSGFRFSGVLRVAALRSIRSETGNLCSA